MNISNGKKLAKATGIRIIKTEGGAIAIEVGFQFTENNVTYTLPWQGWLKNKSGGTDAMERTLSTLTEVLEYNGDQQVVNVPENDPRRGMLVNQDAINRMKDVQIDVENESYEARDGSMRTRPRVKWVNNIGGGGFAGIAPESVQSDLDAIGFKAAFMAAKQGKAQANPQTQQQASTLAKAFNADDLPY